jgi:hypothetical protein
MRRLNITLTAGACACALVAGCTTTTKQTMYWTEKSGVVVVHHVQAGVDRIEKLSAQKLSDSDVQAQHLPEGKYFKVVEAEQVLNQPAKHVESGIPKTMQDSKQGVNGSKLAEISKQSGSSNDRIAEKIADIRREVQTVAAENRRLQEQISASAQQSVQQGSQQQETAQQIPDAPRLSQ